MGELSAGARKYFDAANYATVTSINPDGGPQSTVVWVRTDGDDILFSTVKGRRKHRNFARDPRASILIIDSDNPYVYVEVRGNVTMEDDPTGSLIQELSRKYSGQDWKEPEGNERVIVRVTPEKVTLRG
ncbi:PPOX class F420-dependent oxidoreductase [Nonomuraea soli]|uniref:PPOX class probable F420-dependent enzyme n=1 Tax=Nonomuraea soli TaxID=1032476 RepID=A0A7W0CTM0_9ACTN|nr:PPOX class F420-dependent oxidoreductase [Nonomuraea soli]MBA2897045.1 PPOX class probable F420-dependent enzyme [Nonomuraea soli]